MGHDVVPTQNIGLTAQIGLQLAGQNLQRGGFADTDRPVLALVSGGK